MIYWQDRINVAITELKEVFTEEQFNVLERYISLKINEAVDDLEDQINQRGMYDPDS